MGAERERSGRPTSSAPRPHRRVAGRSHATTFPVRLRRTFPLRNSCTAPGTSSSQVLRQSIPPKSPPRRSRLTLYVVPLFDGSLILRLLFSHAQIPEIAFEQQHG